MKILYCVPVVVVIAVLLSGCDGQPRDEQDQELDVRSAQPDSLYYQFSSFHKRYGDCTSDTTAYCTRIDLSYPQFQSDIFTKQVDKINKSIKQAVLNEFSPDSSETKSVNQFADQFISDYKEIKAAFGEALGWYAKMNGTVLRNDSTVIVIKLYSDLYTGGAHGNVTVQYLNFDRETGNQIKFDFLFVSGYEKRLNQVAAQKFREKHGLPPGSSLSDAGFHFEGEQYYNKDNFALLPGGIKFYFNNYEIAPYSSGPSEIMVKYEELQNLLNKKNFIYR